MTAHSLHNVHVGGAVGGFFGHAAAVVIGLLLMFVGLALGVTMVLLPVGLVVGIAGVLLFVGGLFGHIFKKT